MAKQLKQAVAEASVPAAPMKALFERVEDYMDSNGWNYSKGEDKQAFAMDVAVTDGKVRVVLNVVESEGLQQVLVYSIFPIFVPEHSRARMAEGITRINYATSFGNFEMDLKDGEVRVRTVLEGDGFVAEPMIDRAVRKSLDLADQYQAALLAIAFGNESPQKILEMAERADGSTLQ